jgi:hypothetical protein
MKQLYILTLSVACFMISGSFMSAQTPTSAEVVESILSIEDYRTNLTEAKAAIDALLADTDVTDQQVRQMLVASKTAIMQMLDQKTAASSPQLVDLVSWVHDKHKEVVAIADGETSPSAEQSAYLNSLLFKGGFDTSLTTVLRGVVGSCVRIDKEACAVSLLEAYLQLYLRMGPVLEEDSWRVPDKLLFYAPQWTQSRYPQLAADQKIRFLKDVNDAREERAEGPGADEEPTPPPTPQEQAAYEAAYQFIVNNTPQP